MARVDGRRRKSQRVGDRWRRIVDFGEMGLSGRRNGLSSISFRSLVKGPGQVEKARWRMELWELWVRPWVVLMLCSKGWFVDVAACVDGRG